ncbi:octopamine receptor beta-2R-like [Montipora capricornis]|uniref:octopamine receptor beta-2R-like n=1 Tax=Montipora capricornis TaxID=246305 RepID=UPI0035F1AF07
MGNISTAEEVSSYIAEPISPKTFLALIVSWSLLGILSAGLNILVCAMLYIDKKLRTITNYLVVSLSVSDLLIAVVFVPFYIIDHYARTVIGGYFVAFILLATVFNLCGVTYERYIALTRPFRYRTIMSCRKVCIIIGTSWLLPLVLSLLPLAWNTDVDATVHKVYIAVIVILFIFIPCTAMVFVYLRVLRVAHRFVLRSKERTSKGNVTGHLAGSDEKATRVFAMVFAMFLLCWLPLIYINISWILNQTSLVTNEVIFISFFTLLLNSIFDPFICAFYKRDFRGVLRKRFKLGCFKEIEQQEIRIDSDLALRRLSSASKHTAGCTQTQ